MKKTKIILTLLLVFPFFAALNRVKAAEEDVGYSVQAILPEDRQNPASSYFDLEIEPDEELALQVKIYNHENTELEVDLSAPTATTNSNGLIVYEETKDFDESLEHAMTDLVSFEEERVTIPPNDSKTILAKLETPKEEFDGELLGALRVQKVVEETQENEGVQINNQYAYVIGLKLRMNDQEIAPDLKLQKVEPSLDNYRTALRVNIQNPTATIIRDLAIFAEVFKEDRKTPLYTAKQEDGKFAPNSAMDFYVDWGDQPLKAGNYRLEMTATDGNETWEWNEDFTIEEEVEGVNEEAVDLDTNASTIQWLALVIGVLLLIIVGLLTKQFKSYHEKN